MIFTPAETITEHSVTFTEEEFELILKREYGLAQKGKFKDLLCFQLGEFNSLYGRPQLEYDIQRLTFKIKHERGTDVQLILANVKYCLESYIRYASMMKHRVPMAVARAAAEGVDITSNML